MRKLEEAEKRMLEMSGLEESKINAYKVGFEFDQNYESVGEFLQLKMNENTSEIGLVRPMVINSNVDPYSGRTIKSHKKKYRSTCCCIPCC